MRVSSSALELAIVDSDRTRYERLAAGTKLVKIWAAMRTSDAASCPPLLFVFDESGPLGRAHFIKPQVKGKKVGAIHWQISTEATSAFPTGSERGGRILYPSLIQGSAICRSLPRTRMGSQIKHLIMHVHVQSTISSWPAARK